MLELMKGAIFDLDGVIVDTAKYHYLAWKWLAGRLGFDFTEADNERLKGVSRTRSLEILLEIGGLHLGDDEKAELARIKNERYVGYIAKIDESELLPGAKKYIASLRDKGVKTALGSASKNAELILANLQVAHLFDAIVDGNKVAQAKPDPEVFLVAGRELGLEPGDCVVFEDAVAGVQAAKSAGMRVVGIGKKDNLSEADMVVDGLHVLADADYSRGLPET